MAQRRREGLSLAMSVLREMPRARNKPGPLISIFALEVVRSDLMAPVGICQRLNPIFGA
jgi:hypothetical protein